MPIRQDQVRLSGRSKEGPIWRGNRLTIRRDELDERILIELAGGMLRAEVVDAFLADYQQETSRLAAETVSARAARQLELADINNQIALARSAILNGVDAAMFVEELRVRDDRPGEQDSMEITSATLSAALRTQPRVSPESRKPHRSI